MFFAAFISTFRDLQSEAQVRRSWKALKLKFNQGPQAFLH
jgi:hypothetical protein